MAYETTGVIFNTQKFSIHDGDGMRTLIFMKGCPLRCLWCSNPESQEPEVEIMDVKSKCVGCGKCVLLCENHAVKAESFDIDRKLCRRCGACARKCYANAKKIVGQTVTIREMMRLIEKDRIFYTNSGGGVTIGGGEPLMQREFVEELLKTCRASNLHTAIETCGYGKWEDVKGVFEAADQIFFDLKAMDPALHRRLTGADNERILENACRLAAFAGAEKDLIFRIPLVPGCNDSRQNIEETARFAASLQRADNRISVEILPYHNLGEDKYRWLNRDYPLPGLKKFSSETVDEYKDLLRRYCLCVI